MSDLIQAARDGLLALTFPDEVKRGAADALQRWLTEPVHADARPQLEAMVRAGRFDQLLDAFWRVMPFGTGGRRGPVGLGTNRFNAHTLLGSVQGHAELLAESYPGQQLSVVVAYDVRVFEDQRGVYDRSLPNPLLGVTSADFARRAAGVYAANGVGVLMLDPAAGLYMATPELSLAIRRHGAHGGLNVSASHNHPDDNGGKFYNRHGGQDVPPDDEVLALRVESITTIRELPFEQAVAEGKVTFLGPEDNAAYLAMNAALSEAPEARGGRIVYSPLNGTGSMTVGRLLRSQGFDVRAVPEQEGFDGRFPTVRFLAPNPEQPSCYELAEVVGSACDAQLVMTTDPDADRIGVEARGPDGGWVFIDGNDTLLLVVHHVLSHRAARGTLPPDAFLIKTLVTSSRVTTIAESFGCHVVGDLLVGFKYMADVLAALEDHGRWRELTCSVDRFVMGVEESHGVLMTHEVRDKDAAGPALALAELNALCAAQGRTLLDELARIQATFGYMAHRLKTTVMTGAEGLAGIRAMQDSLRADPPAEVAGRRVVSCDDQADPTNWMGPIRSETDAAARNVLVFTLDDGSRVIIRPSGTEPKSKMYIEVPGRRPDAPLTEDELAAERERCEAEADRLGSAFEALALERIGVMLSSHAQAVSGLLPIELKRHASDVFLPGLAERVASGTRGAALEAWIDEQLAGYGSSPRALVAGGVASWMAEARLEDGVRSELQRLFARG